MTEQTEQRLAFLAGLSVGSRVSTKKYGNGTIARRSMFYDERQWLVKYDNSAMEWVNLKEVGAEGEYKPEVKKNAKVKNAAAGQSAAV